ncbi:Tetrapyrrole-binding protein, chloroplastic, partial [Mucuna pruriens]
MATNSLHCSIQHHHHHSLIKRHHLTDTPHITSLIVKSPSPTPNITLSHSHSHSHSASHITFSLSQTTASTAVSFDVLRDHLCAQNFRQADEETRRLLIALAGEAAQERGYVFFSEVKFIPETALKSMDALWQEHSGGRFGYSVQKKILEKVGGDFTKFFVKVGWMKKLDTEVEQYNYRSFPTEFTWDLSDDTPEGHLPLTNALRGTQLLSNLLNHPAFHNNQQQPPDITATGFNDNASSSKPFTQRIFKPDYGF